MVNLFLFVFGAIVGSFLNVVGLRFRSGLNLGGRSACASCAKTLSWWELVPVVSFIFLRARCSACKTKISWQYPLVELWVGILFVSLFSFYGLTISYLLATLIFCIYTVILIYDIRHKIIPDSLVYTSIALALVSRLISGGTLFDWLIGPILFSFFGLIWLISKGRALGLGDAKLFLSVGFLLGGNLAVSAFALSFWIGTLVTLPFVFFGMLLGQKKLTIKSEIPFAPFIILGAWASIAFGFDLLYVIYS